MKNLDEIISITELPNNSTKLLKLIKDTNDCAKKYKIEIEKLKKINQAHDIHSKTKNPNNETIIPYHDNVTTDDKEEIDDIASLYYEDYVRLAYDFTEDDLISILPVRNNIYFKNVIMKLHAESLKTINDIFEYINDLNSSDAQLEKAELIKMLEHEKRKISLLKKIANEKDDVTLEQTRKNKIVLIQRNSGNVIPISDLDEIPFEQYGQLYDLVNSIIDGTFKGLKLLKSNYRLKKVYELKTDQARVIFNKIDKNTYAIITVFIKKIRRDNYYIDFINARANHYNSIRTDIVSKLDDPDFIQMNDANVEKFLNILNPMNVSKKYIKDGGIYD